MGQGQKKGLALKCLPASLVNGFDPATPVVVDVYNVDQRLHICGSNKPTRGFVNKQNTDEPSYTSLTGNNTVNPIPNNPIQIYSLVFFSDSYTWIEAVGVDWSVCLFFAH